MTFGFGGDLAVKRIKLGQCRVERITQFGEVGRGTEETTVLGVLIRDEDEHVLRVC